MKSSDWQPMETAPLNPYGQAFGPVILIWCDADNHPWPAYFEPHYDWKCRDPGPAWVVPDQGPITPEDALAWMPIAAPWSVLGVPTPQSSAADEAFQGQIADYVRGINSEGNL